MRISSPALVHSVTPLRFGKNEPPSIETIVESKLGTKKDTQRRFYEPKPWKTFTDAVVTTVKWGFTKPVLKFDVNMSEADRQKMKALAASDHSIIITPNHTRKLLDILTMMELGRKTGITAASMSAIERFEAVPIVGKYFWQWLGCFSVDRSATNKDESVKEGRSVVEKGMPMLVFPNGAPLGNSRDVGPMKHGAAKIAIDAVQGGNLQKKGVKILPLSLFYEHKGDITSFLERKVAELECLLEKDGIPMEPPLANDSPLHVRVNRLFNAVVRQREQKYVAPEDKAEFTPPDAYERLQWMLHYLMNRLERKYGITTDLLQPISWRTSTINGKLREKTKAARKAEDKAAEKDIQRDMKALRDIRKLSLYQKDYVNGDDQDRMFDLLAKMHETVTGKEMDPVIYNRNQRVLVQVHEPIDVAEFLNEHAGNDNPQPADIALTERIRATLQAGLTAREAIRKAQKSSR